MAVLALSNDQLKTRKNLHVQSFSKWAPANIGPYSQANLIGGSQLIMLAGQIGLNPGLMCLRPSLAQQFDQIVCNYNSTLKEITQCKDEDADLIEKYCVKAILYVSRDTVIDGELQAKIKTFQKYTMPVVILRVNTLPKNAPLELEMVAVPNKQELQ